MPVFRHEEAGDIEVRRGGWKEFASWSDQFARESTREDSYQNLWAALAVSPSAAELPDLIDDFSALPVMVADQLMTLFGVAGKGFEGLGSKYETTGWLAAEEEHKRAAELTRMLGLPDVPESERRAIQEEHAALWLIPLDQIAAAKKRSRRAFFVRTPLGVWAVRPPKADAAADYSEAKDAWAAGKDGASLAEACRALVLACVLSPEPSAVQAAIEEYPAIVPCLTLDLVERTGAGKALVRVS